jgi:hypothetical protein
MSDAAIRTVKPPSASAVADAVDGAAITRWVAAAVPVPISQRPSRRTPGLGSRSPQPNRRAPSRKQAITLRLPKGSPDTGPRSGSLRMRSSIGSMPVFSASSSMADSSANAPGVSPGDRM